MSKESYTLVVWEELPENISYYLVPNSVITEEYRNILEQSHQKIINSSDDVEFTDILNHMLCEDYGDESYYHPEMPRKYWSIWYQYKLNLDKSPLINSRITSVYVSGFMM